MAYNLRLPAALDADARERCERLGISLNALLCVALDGYLRGNPGVSDARDSPGHPGTGLAAAERETATAGRLAGGFVAESSVPGQPLAVSKDDAAERARVFPKLSKAQRRDITARERAARKGVF